MAYRHRSEGRAFTSVEGRDLVLTRHINAPRERVYPRLDRSPGMIPKWFTPAPWTVEDLKAHEAMGFHQGWPIATEQLAALVE